jgi:hypothetical protein
MKASVVSRLGLTVAIAGLLMGGSAQVAAANPPASDSGWQLTGQVGGQTKALAIQGQTLYLGLGLHIEALDISNPASPTPIGSSPILADSVNGLFADGSGYLYAACGSAGLQILDISKPASPALIGSYDSSGYAENVSVVGNYAILADGPDGVQVLSISDPRHPTWVGQIDTGAYAYDARVSGYTLYAAQGGSGLLVADLSHPSRPQVKPSVNIGGFAYSLAFSGQRIYAATAWGGLAVLDASNPLAPVVTDHLAVNGWAMSVAAQGSNLLVEAGADGTQMYDISAKPAHLEGAFADVGFALVGGVGGPNGLCRRQGEGAARPGLLQSGEPPPSRPLLPHGRGPARDHVRNDRLCGRRAVGNADDRPVRPSPSARDLLDGHSGRLRHQGHRLRLQGLFVGLGRDGRPIAGFRCQQPS